MPVVRLVRGSESQPRCFGCRLKVCLREFYSFTNSNGRMQGDAAGRLLIQGTRYSQHNNIFGQQRQIVVGPFGIILNTPYRY